MDNSEIYSTYPIRNDQDADLVINCLKKQLELYKDKNSQFESVFSKLKLTPDSLSSASRETLEIFTKLQDASGVNKLDPIDVQSSYLEHASARYNYQDKVNAVKDHLENLQQFISDVNQEVKTVEQETTAAKAFLEKIAPISDAELQKLNLQVESYEKKLLQFINKYPWINEPEYNLLNIQDEIKKVYRLQDELKGLKKEIDSYYGLKPDLYTAKKQLSQIKIEYENLSKQFTEAESPK